ncbi:MAG: xylose isomerase [Pedosphaera sp.]|nr:xylose isomerase [Pedosphaera sp.]
MKHGIKDLKIDGTVAVELKYAPVPSKIVEWVEEAYHETGKLMELVGLRD